MKVSEGGEKFLPDRSMSGVLVIVASFFLNVKLPAASCTCCIRDSESWPLASPQHEQYCMGPTDWLCDTRQHKSKHKDQSTNKQKLLQGCTQNCPYLTLAKVNV